MPFQSAIGNWQSAIRSLGLFMIGVFPTTTTILAKLKPIRRGLLILSCDVVAVLAVGALQHNVIAWHKLFPISDFRLPIGDRRIMSIEFVTADCHLK